MKKIEKHQSSGWAGLFGLPFFLAGCGFLYAMISPSTNWSGDRPSLYFGVPFCSVFIFIGASILFGRWGYKFDPLRKEGHTYWGLLIPMIYKRFRFADIDHVLITSEVRRNKNSSYTVYPIRLILKEGKPINIENGGRTYLTAREQAEKIARRCGLKLLNTKEGNQVQEAHEVDKSFKEKITGHQQTPSCSEPTHLQYTNVFNEHKIESFHETSWLEQIIPLVIIFVFFIPMFTIVFFMFKDINDSLIQNIFMGVMLTPITLIIFQRLLSKSSGFEILIKNKKLSLIRKSILKKTETIEIENIDDISFISDRSLKPKEFIASKLFSIQKHGVYIIAGDKVLKPGPIKTAADEKYLHDLLMYTIANS